MGIARAMPENELMLNASRPEGEIPREVLLGRLVVGSYPSGVELADDPVSHIVTVAGIVDEVWAPCGGVEGGASKGDHGAKWGHRWTRTTESRLKLAAPSSTPYASEVELTHQQ